jgi:hypothetical protein
MLVVIATAEPRGAYHLTPLGDAVAAASASFVHLVPYPEPVQGESVVPVTHDLRVLEACDRVVVTGGTLSAWTELVVRRAAVLTKPVIFSELAYVGTPGPLHPGVEIAHATALSTDGAASLRRYLGIDVVYVTGTPALDRLPVWSPVARRAVLLSTSDMAQRDPDRTLVAIGRALTADGWDVRVRLHPREDPEPWVGFAVVSGETPAESASAAQVVIGYPGSAHMLAAAVGAPVISVTPTEELRQVLTPLQQQAMSSQTTGLLDTLGSLGRVVPAARDAVAAVVGPLGGAASRLVDAWTTALH